MAQHQIRQAPTAELACFWAPRCVRRGRGRGLRSPARFRTGRAAAAPPASGRPRAARARGAGGLPYTLPYRGAPPYASPASRSSRTQRW